MRTKEIEAEKIKDKVKYIQRLKKEIERLKKEDLAAKNKLITFLAYCASHQAEKMVLERRNKELMEEMNKMYSQTK